MPDDVLNEMYPASFRGVPFLFVSTSRKGGRKTAIHEYPNTNRRKIEDMGLDVPTFTVPATIASQTNYMEIRDRFIAALDEPGPGQLVHPFYGTLTVAALSYEINESIQHLGVAEIQIEFSITGDVSQPVLSSKPIASVSQAKKEAETIVTQDILNNYNVLPSDKFQQTFVKNTFQDIGNVMNNAFSVLGSFQTLTSSLYDIDVLNTISVFDQTYNSEYNSAFRYFNKMITQPEYFASGALSVSNMLLNIFDLFTQVDVDTSQQLVGVVSTFGYLPTDLDSVVTIQEEKAQENIDLVSGYFNLLSLANAYDLAINSTYVTVDEVDRLKASLNNQYELVISFDNLHPDAIYKLQDMRNSALEFFTDIEQTLYRTVEIDHTTMPLSTLVYQYYGNLNLYEDIVSLNGVKETMFKSPPTTLLLDI